MIKVDMKRIVTRYIPSLKLNIIYKIGKDADNNFELIEKAHSNDLWFHVNNAPSCHVIACLKNIIFNTSDDELPNFYDIDFDNLDKKQKQQIVTQGALICKQFSKFKKEKKVEIIYTQIINIQKTEQIGSVIVSKSKIVTI